MDYLKHKKVLEMTSPSDAGELSDEKQLKAEILEDERRRSLHAAIQKLRMDMQTVIHLVYFEELSYEEAAVVMKKKRKQLTCGSLAAELTETQLQQILRLLQPVSV